MSGRGASGSKTYNDGVSYSGYYSDITSQKVNVNDTEILPEGRITLEGDISITPDDKITMPDGSTPRILSVKKARDMRGAVHHTTIYLGGGI